VIDADRVGAGVDAENLLNRLRPYLSRKRDAMITKLIAHHNTESLTEPIMRSGIAHLAAIDELERELGHRIKLGQKDLAESMRP
jgi:hypothetical protein